MPALTVVLQELITEFTQGRQLMEHLMEIQSMVLHLQQVHQPGQFMVFMISALV